MHRDRRRRSTGIRTPHPKAKSLHLEGRSSLHSLADRGRDGGQAADATRGGWPVSTGTATSRTSCRTSGGCAQSCAAGGFRDDRRRSFRSPAGDKSYAEVFCSPISSGAPAVVPMRSSNAATVPRRRERRGPRLRFRSTAPASSASKDEDRAERALQQYGLDRHRMGGDRSSATATFAGPIGRPALACARRAPGSSMVRRRCGRRSSPGAERVGRRPGWRTRPRRLLEGNAVSFGVLPTKHQTGTCAVGERIDRRLTGAGVGSITRDDPPVLDESRGKWRLIQVSLTKKRCAMACVRRATSAGDRAGNTRQRDVGAP